MQQYRDTCRCNSGTHKILSLVTIYEVFVVSVLKGKFSC